MRKARDSEILLIFQRKIHQINPPTLRSVVGGEGESLREGEGSDFAIQAPSPSLIKKENPKSHFLQKRLRNTKNKKRKEKIVENLGELEGR